MSFNQNLAYNPNALSCSVPATAARERRSVIRARRSPEPTEAKVAGNVTEIILPEGQVENFQLLLPMLTQLNQEKRWLAWIDPPQALVSKWQKNAWDRGWRVAGASFNTGLSSSGAGRASPQRGYVPCGGHVDP